MKKVTALVVVFAMLFLVSANVTALDLDNIKLSEGTDDELIAFLNAYCVEIPGGEENWENWIDFIRNTICQVENNPYTNFVYNFTISQDFAENIQSAVLRYYGYDDIDYSVYSSVRSTDAYELQDSTIYRSWSSSFLNYNCYSYALGKTDARRNPGNISGIYYSTLPSLASMKSYVEQDLATLGYSCVNITTNRPTSSTIPSGAKVICLRMGSSDYHFMRYTTSGWTHKPGQTQILLWNYASPGAKYWTNEYAYMDIEYEGDCTYNSTIYYYIYQQNHSYTVSYADENYHSDGQHYYKMLNTCEGCGDYYYSWDVLDCDGPPCLEAASVIEDAIALARE